MRRGKGQRESYKSACSKIFVMIEKDPNGRKCGKCANEMIGLQGGAKVMMDGHTLQERQSSVLTNQCL